MPRVASDEITIMDITDGDPAPRLASRRLFRALTNVPQTPQATITWATNALSNIETGWSETAPTQQAASDTSVYFSDLLFSDTTGTATTTTATGTSPLSVTSFSGLVTFSSGDFSKDGSTITDIDGGNIATNSIIAATVSVGNLVTDSSAKPVSGAGAIVSSSGDVSFGDSDKYVSWDTSAGNLSIKGDITNIATPFIEGLAGSWLMLTHRTSPPYITSLSSMLSGAGLYRFIMVGGGGAGCTAEPGLTGRRAASGGGSSSIAMWTLDWNGTDQLGVELGFGGAASNSTLGQGGDGGSSNFYIGGTASTDIRITCPGGEGGTKVTSGDNVLNSGGAGGAIPSIQNGGHSSISQTVFRVGHRGGNATYDCGVKVSGQATTPENGMACAGGAGVNFLGISSTRGGDCDISYGAGSVAAAAGGGIFGQGYDISGGSLSAQGQAISSTSASPIHAGLSRVMNEDDTNYAFLTGTTQGGQSFLGPYLGNLPPGNSTCVAVPWLSKSITGLPTVSAAQVAALARPANQRTSMSGGGGAAFLVDSLSANPNGIGGENGEIFNGGGAGASMYVSTSSAQTRANGGFGGIGAGGGGGQTDGTGIQGDGGGGGLFIMRL